jgi:hypothetical protein
MEYESVTQKKVLLLVESILQNAKQLRHALLSWHVRYLNIIGDGNPNSNLVTLYFIFLWHKDFGCTAEE